MTEQADLQSIGKHCSLDSCNRVDFLPLKCDFCEKNFCRDHSGITAHSCPKYDKKVDGTSSNLEPIILYKCSLENCTNQKEIVRVICEFCGNDFCMKHRLQIDHNCSKLPDKSQSDNQKAKEKKEFNFEVKQNVSEKNMSLAAKVQMMKLKQTAVGPAGLPEESKFYCFVQYNNEQSAQTKKAFYFSIKWPVGKCNEFIKEKFKIETKRVELYLNENLIDTSSTVETLLKENKLQSNGPTLDLKVV